MEYCYLERAERGNVYEVCTYPLETVALSIPLLVLALIPYLIYQDRKDRINTVLAKCERILDNAE